MRRREQGGGHEKFPLNEPQNMFLTVLGAVFNNATVFYLSSRRVRARPPCNPPGHSGGAEDRLRV